MIQGWSEEGGGGQKVGARGRGSERGRVGGKASKQHEQRKQIKPRMRGTQRKQNKANQLNSTHFSSAKPTHKALA